VCVRACLVSVAAIFVYGCVVTCVRRGVIVRVCVCVRCMCMCVCTHTFTCVREDGYPCVDGSMCMCMCMCVCVCVEMCGVFSVGCYTHTHTSFWMNFGKEPYWCRALVQLGPVYCVCHYTPPKNGEIALWPSTNGSIPHILVLAGRESIFTEIRRTNLLVNVGNPELQYEKFLRYCTNGSYCCIIWRLSNMNLHFTARVFGRSAISPFLGGHCSAELVAGHFQSFKI